MLDTYRRVVPTQAFLAAREYMDSIVTLIHMMMDTDFPCWRPTTIPNVLSRFQQGEKENHTHVA